MPEVLIGGEGLARAVAVLGTLLHEAAHALCHVSGIKDTSRQGSWHDARLKGSRRGGRDHLRRTRGLAGPRPPSRP